MKFAGIKASFFFPLFFFFVCLSRDASAEGAGVEQFQSQFEEVKTRLGAIEVRQQSILAQKDQVLEKINQVRIWVRHSGGGPGK